MSAAGPLYFSLAIISVAYERACCGLATHHIDMTHTHTHTLKVSCELVAVQRVGADRYTQMDKVESRQVSAHS